MTNRFRDPATRPQWAELTRWAGDRASILFEDLRRRIGAIEGLREALHFAGAEVGWVARYCVGDVVLFDVEFFPGILESTVYIPASQQRTPQRFRLTNARSVRTLAKLIRQKNRRD